MKAIIEAVKAHYTLPDDSVMGVGISGGLDSMLLAEALYRAELPFRALHFNHNWRGAESKSDQDFVRTWCRQRNVPFSTRTCPSPKRTEASARHSRHQFFRAMTDRYALPAIMLAHHQNDLAETFLLQLLRGAGPEGLSSLLPQREVDGLTLVRPLLSFPKKELTRIARKEKIQWIEDSSNSDESFTRNVIRRRLIPYLAKYSERDPIPLLSRTADILKVENDYWKSQLPITLPARLPISLLQNKHLAYQRRLIRQWLLQETAVTPSFDEIESISTLLARISPAKTNLKHGKYCRRRSGYLFIE